MKTSTPSLSIHATPDGNGSSSCTGVKASTSFKRTRMTPVGTRQYSRLVSPKSPIGGLVGALVGELVTELVAKVLEAVVEGSAVKGCVVEGSVDDGPEVDTEIELEAVVEIDCAVEAPLVRSVNENVGCTVLGAVDPDVSGAADVGKAVNGPDVRDDVREKVGWIVLLIPVVESVVPAPVVESAVLDPNVERLVNWPEVERDVPTVVLGALVDEVLEALVDVKSDTTVCADVTVDP